jgi:hypothetical protein
MATSYTFGSIKVGVMLCVDRSSHGGPRRIWHDCDPNSRLHHLEDCVQSHYARSHPYFPAKLGSLRADVVLESRISPKPTNSRSTTSWKEACGGDRSDAVTER